MKLLWLSHFVPYPPQGGSRQRSFNLIRHISTKHETHLIALNMQGETDERVAEFAAKLKEYCASVEIWPPPYRWRGARWWAQLAFSPFYRPHYGACALWSPELARRWQAALIRHSGALIHFDSIDLALYLPLTAGFRKVLNHHNCESAMAARRAKQEPNPFKRAYLHNQARKLRRLEEQLCHQFDLNLAVSHLDAQALQAHDPGAHLHIVENGTDTDYFHPSSSEPEPNTLVFSGSLDWYPNVGGIRFFCHEVWPKLKQKSPGIRLYLAGRSPSREIVRLAESDQAIELIANPVDIRPWVWKAAVFICPIIDGGGTRLKILDAFAMGKAVVSTAAGAEGLEVSPGIDLLVADRPEEFSEQIVHLLRHDDSRKRLAGSARRVVENLYGWRTVAGHLLQAYQCAAERPAVGHISPMCSS
jgi:glycosyltransferase involved in cell wall biosynthesis